MRLTRWIEPLARAGCEAEVLCPSSDEEFAAFDGARGDHEAVARYYRACVRNQWRNVRRAAHADVVVMHRGLFPFSPWQRPTFERLLTRLNDHLVYDFYDSIWLQARAAHEGAPSRLGSWLYPSDKIESIIRLARVVTVSNEFLAGFAREHHGDVRIIPMLVDPGDYAPREAASSRSPVVIGWMGNRHQIPRLLSLTPALQKLAQERDIKLTVVTGDPVEIPGVQVEVRTHAWTAKREQADLAEMDIGLLPLEDNSHDRGKSPLKLLQYSAAGLPVVATPVAMDGTAFETNQSFLPATSESEWLDALVRLVDDAQLRARLGDVARATVTENYSFDHYLEPFMDILRTAAAPEADGRR